MVRKLAYLSSAGLFVIILGVILLFVYFIASNHNISWDLSRTGANTLDSKTINVLNSLDFDVKMLIFDKEGREKKHAAEVMDLYVTASNRITYMIIDPDARPGMSARYGVDRYGQAVIIGRNRQSLIERVTEENVTNALIKLKRDRKKVIYLTTGHGERDISGKENQGLSQLGSALKRDDYEVHALLLMRRQQVPGNADLLIAAGPRKRFLREELEIIQKYLGNGGSMLITLEPGGNAGLDGLLDEYGIVLDDGIIIDTISTILGSDYTVPVVNTYGDVPALRGFAYATVFPTSRSLMIRQEHTENLKVDWLARTSDQSWSELDFITLIDEGEADRGPEEVHGPLNVAVLARDQVGADLRSSLMVFGDTDFLTNAYLNVSGNKDLTLNCINMLLNESHLITIDTNIARDRPFILTPDQTIIVFWVPVVVVPCLILCAALVVFWVRRRA